MQLTKRTIEALAASMHARIVFDEDLPGFGVRIAPSGRKTFVVQYRVGGGRGGRQRRVSVGTFGTTTPEDARTEAKKILARAHLGDDFADQRDKTRNARTVSELIDEWSMGGALINRRTGAKRQQVNINNDIALANHHLKPLMGVQIAIISAAISDDARVDRQRLRFSTTPDLSADAPALQSTGGFRLGEGGGMSGILRPVWDSTLLS